MTSCSDVSSYDDFEKPQTSYKRARLSTICVFSSDGDDEVPSFHVFNNVRTIIIITDCL